MWPVLAPREVRLFVSNARCRHYAKGRRIFEQGDPCAGLYFVKSGLVGIRMSSSDGQSALVRLVGPGDAMGYRPLLSSSPHIASAVVIQDAEICHVRSAFVHEVLKTNHELALNLLEQAVSALTEAEGRAFELAAHSVDVRLAHLLTLFNDRWGRKEADGTTVLTLPIRRQDVASMIGAHPDSVGRAIKRLEKAGLIAVAGRKVRIAHMERLVHVVSEEDRTVH
jgi:CRP/FNR family transcriptional regulator